VLNLTLQSTLIVMLGSALGGGARLGTSTLIARFAGSAFPWGTLGVNIAGCLAVGVVAALLAPPGRMHGLQDLRLFLVTGFLGGFTTFSAFALETVLLFERGQTLAAAGYVLASTIGCVLAAGITYFALATALR
jgi:CrcB protein